MNVKLNLKKNGITNSYLISYTKDPTKTNDENLSITRGKIFTIYAPKVGVAPSPDKSLQLIAMKSSARRYYSKL